jgi:translocator protein
MPNVTATSTSTRRRDVRTAVIGAALWAVMVAGIGGLATDLGPWYRQLQQPWWKPPDWAFGPAWTLIFTLAAVAGGRAWLGARQANQGNKVNQNNKVDQGAQRHRVVLAFVVNGVLNVAWSYLFFFLHRPDWALGQVGVLWLSIVALIIVTKPLDTWAPWLLLPYAVWVAYAASINAGVVWLNAPF